MTGDRGLNPCMTRARTPDPTPARWKTVDFLGTRTPTLTSL
jgi:hypothetical protein